MSRMAWDPPVLTEQQSQDGLALGHEHCLHGLWLLLSMSCFLCRQGLTAGLPLRALRSCGGKKWARERKHVSLSQISPVPSQSTSPSLPCLCLAFCSGAGLPYLRRELLSPRAWVLCICSPPHSLPSLPLWKWWLWSCWQSPGEGHGIVTGLTPALQCTWAQAFQGSFLTSSPHQVHHQKAL